MIRRWEKEDLDRIVELGAKMWQEGSYSYLLFDERKTKETLNYLMDNPFIGMGWVAEKDGKIIGGIIVHLTKFFFSEQLICNDLALFVDAKERTSLRVPIRLIKEAEEWARLKGAKEFCPASSVRIKSDSVAKLYEFLKYDKVGHLFKKRL